MGNEVMGNNYLLWENEQIQIKTPFNPHVPYSEGPHLIITPKHEIESAWADIDLSTDTFKVASLACRAMASADFAPWFNIQANANWGLLPAATPFFHVHVYGRNKTKR